MQIHSTRIRLALALHDAELRQLETGWFQQLRRLFYEWRWRRRELQIPVIDVIDARWLR